MPHHAKFSLQCMWLVALPNPSKAVVVSFSRYLQYHGLHIQWESCSSRDVHQLGFNGNIMKHQHHPHPQKPSKLRKTPVIPCLNCLKASKVRVSTFGIPDFIMSMYSMQNTRWNKLWAESKNTAVLSLRSLLTFEDHVCWNVQRLNIEERNIWKTMKNCNSWQLICNRETRWSDRSREKIWCNALSNQVFTGLKHGTMTYQRLPFPDWQTANSQKHTLSTTSIKHNYTKHLKTYHRHKLFVIILYYFNAFYLVLCAKSLFLVVGSWPDRMFLDFQGYCSCWFDDLMRFFRIMFSTHFFWIL